MSPVIGPSPVVVPGGPTPPGPCDWPVNLTCCPGWADYSLAVQTNAMAWAVQILDSLTGRRFAQCARSWRPCGPKCGGPAGYLSFPVNSGSTTSAGMPWMVPWIDNGVWRNCGCNGGCTCRARCEVPFPTPVAQVVEVTIDGLILDPTAYRLDLYRGIPVLVRTDGECWPECQDMDAEADEEGSFVIVYQPGELVPLAGQIAAGLLACEFAKLCVGADCALPQQLASLSRNGVEVQVVDPASLLENGLTGIAQVDLWIRSVNPHQRPSRTRVLSPDVPGPRFTV
jgi:hypothetical protein